MKRVLSAAAALIAVTLVLAGCGGSKKSSSGSEGTTMTTVGGVAANDHGSKQVSGKTEVELDDFYFEPTVLKGKPGARVTLELKNEGSTEHNFSIDSQKINQDVDAGETKTVTVTFPRSGQISFYCKYHKGKGRAGALTTTGASGSGGGTTTTTGTTSTGGGY
jgi:plastocyanin